MTPKMKSGPKINITTEKGWPFKVEIINGRYHLRGYGSSSSKCNDYMIKDDAIYCGTKNCFGHDCNAWRRLSDQFGVAASRIRQAVKLYDIELTKLEGNIKDCS
ncbi:hypothetical protein [Aeromonas veronii]|uniref:hypothetical protein n=1 Tax=Aeromonas veronii TaxID=654 RepID=UPI002444B0C5|nr:hypothetical protein [Aeromonas veronii]